ncbi:MAG: hypothetical protein JW912_03480 [Sedimentisphaerales bacterium]|nr:hypothetical protein [Sedimentisphaerales bacterium]
MKVYMITEGGEDIGFGHITRCISICQAFEEAGIKPVLIINKQAATSKLLEDRESKTFDWLNDRQLLFDTVKGSDIIFIDSYLADKSLYDSLYNSAKKLVCLDDTKRIEYPPGILLNGAICAEEAYCPQREDTEYLLGSNFIPLRKAFWSVPEKVISKQVKNVLITFGGNGQMDLAERLIGFLNEKFDNLTYNIVAPSQKLAGRDSPDGAEIEMYSNLNAMDMCKLMLKCDICISAGGQTLYELARTGTASVAVCFAENQTENLKGWKSKGFLNYFGWYNDKNLFTEIAASISALAAYSERERCNKIGKSFVDGQGAKRILEHVLSSRVSF